jgi:hypothetical protein
MAEDKRYVERLRRPHAIISITTPEDPEAAIPENPRTQSLLRLVFDDLDRWVDPKHLKRDPVLFSRKLARGILGYLERLPEEVEVLVCHCDAGISRSAAVGAAAAVFFGQSDIPFFRKHCPNRLVYRTLISEMGNRNECVQGSPQPWEEVPEANRHYVLEVDGRQAAVLKAALETYARLGMGQVKAALEAARTPHPGVGQPQETLPPGLAGHGQCLDICDRSSVSDDTRLAWDLMQVVRHGLAWDRHVGAEDPPPLPEFDEPLRVQPEAFPARIRRAEVLRGFYGQD